MAYTQSDLDALDRAIASGVLSVRRNGREVTYRSHDELAAARALVASELAASGILPASSPRSTLAVLYRR